jgi:vacuolar-type H+-ATPase subunit H
MREETFRDPDNAEIGSASIEELLEAEKVVETKLAEARETAAKLVADAYVAAQSIERGTDTRIVTLAQECARENDQRVEGILAEAEEIGKKPIDAKSLRGAIRDAADTLAARLTGSKP